MEVMFASLWVFAPNSRPGGTSNARVEYWTGWTGWTGVESMSDHGTGSQSGIDFVRHIECTSRVLDWSGVESMSKSSEVKTLDYCAGSRSGIDFVRDIECTSRVLDWSGVESMSKLKLVFIVLRVQEKFKYKKYNLI